MDLNTRSNLPADRDRDSGIAIDLGDLATLDQVNTDQIQDGAVTVQKMASGVIPDSLEIVSLLDNHFGNIEWRTLSHHTHQGAFTFYIYGLGNDFDGAYFPLDQSFGNFPIYTNGHGYTGVPSLNWVDSQHAGDVYPGLDEFLNAAGPGVYQFHPDGRVFDNSEQVIGGAFVVTPGLLSSEHEVRIRTLELEKIGDAPEDGQAYVRKDAAWEVVDSGPPVPLVVLTPQDASDWSGRNPGLLGAFPTAPLSILQYSYTYQSPHSHHSHVSTFFAETSFASPVVAADPDGLWDDDSRSFTAPVDDNYTVLTPPLSTISQLDIWVYSISLSAWSRYNVYSSGGPFGPSWDIKNDGPSMPDSARLVIPMAAGDELSWVRIMPASDQSPPNYNHYGFDANANDSHGAGGNFSIYKGDIEI